MSKLFTISDLHLSFNDDKSMDVFKGWDNYTDRIKANWKRTVNDDDTVVLIGDTSWSISLDGAKADFQFLHELPGKKILLKGNHDYWWGTAAKINEFFALNKFDDLKILHNNCIPLGNIGICGTRGWLYDGKTADEKIVLRECGRLKTSIQSAIEQNLTPVVFLHYPPAYGEFACEEIIDVLKEYKIKTLYYGHIHGSGFNNSINSYGKIDMKLVSSDCIDFTPYYICNY